MFVANLWMDFYRTGSLENEQIDSMRQIQAAIGEDVFNQTLKGIIFGKGMTMIFLFSGSFSYYTDREAEGGQMENVSHHILLRHFGYRSRYRRWALTFIYDLHHVYSCSTNTSTGSLHGQSSAGPSCAHGTLTTISSSSKILRAVRSRCSGTCHSRWRTIWQISRQHLIHQKHSKVRENSRVERTATLSILTNPCN